MLVTVPDPSRSSTRRKFAGELDLATEILVLTSLKVAIAEGRPRLEIDFSEVDFMDCSGIRVLLLAQRLADDSHVRFSLVGRSGPVERMLCLTGLTSSFPAPPLAAA